MNSKPTLVVRVSRRFDASSERVFDAWLDAKTAARWLFATPTGKMVRAEIDLRVGGSYNFTDRRDGGDVEHTGEYTEIDRPRRLAFTFRVGQDSDAESRVVVEITPREAGCELTLTNEMDVKWAKYEEPTRAGWAGILEALAKSLG